MGTKTAINVVPIRTTTIWPNAATTVTERDIDLSYGVAVEGVVLPPSFAIYGNVIAERVFDYGSGSAGPLLRRTETSYLAKSNASYFNVHLLDLVSSVTVKDGGGATKSITSFDYDQWPLASSGVTIQRNPFPGNGSLRGNQTTVRRWLNSNGTYRTTTASYFDTGMVKQTTDAGGHTTIFEYGSAYAGAYLTQTRLPDTAGVSHITSQTYDVNTGLIISSTDENSNTTNYTYDAFSRLTQQTDPDGGQSNWVYNDSVPAKLTTTTKITSTTSAVTEVELDGLGRVRKTRLLSDPSGITYTRVTYDALGRRAQEWNPTRCDPDGGPCSENTYGITTYEYDRFNRLAKVIPPDGTSSTNHVTHVYDANVQTTTDQAGKYRKVTKDALGRLTKVEEPPLSSVPALPGSGSVTLSGTEQSTQAQTQAATSGTGSVSLSGAVQSKQVVNQPATAGSGSATISGSVQTAQGTHHPAIPGTGYVQINGFAQSAEDPDDCWVSHGQTYCTTISDYGTVSVSVNGVNKSVTYNGNSTGSTIAVALANAFNADAGSPVTASASGKILYLTSKIGGANTNYPLSAASATANPGVFPAPSFTPVRSGPTLTGGANEYYDTVYDAGSVTLTVNGFSKTASYGQGSSAAGIASALAGAFSSDGASPVNVAVSGATITLTSKATGASTNYSLSSSRTYDTAHFSQASFAVGLSGASLTGGADTTYNTVYDSGSVTITVNGFSKAVSYGQGSTSASVASGLSNAFNGDAASPVNASSSGGTVTLTSKQTGAATNYTLSASRTYNTAEFSQASFTVTPSGSALTGGVDAGYTTVYDSGTVSITVNGFSKSVTFGQSSSSASLAGDLGQLFNGDANSPVAVVVSGNTLYLTSKQPGGSTNYSLSAASSTSQGTYFSQPSFSAAASGASLAGGADAAPGSSTPAFTLYSYDTLGNLTRVEQRGYTADSSQWRVRTSTYDSLSQLLTTTNPESGTITYTYDGEGSVATKTDARGIAVTYGYDPLHRLTGKSYSNGEPPVSYFYDQTSHNGLAIANGKGLRTGMNDSSGATAWSYDTGGAVTAERRTINGVTKTIAYEYNLDGSLKKLTYPSGRAVTYTYDAAARPLSVVDSLNGVNYAQSAAYAPHGALSSIVVGATAGFGGINLNSAFNKRLQPQSITAWSTNGVVLDLSYDFNLGVANNGTLKQMANLRAPNRTQNYTYDELNRVRTAESQAASGPDCWGLQFGYDIWGNMLSSQVTRCWAPMLSQNVNAQNRLAGYSYDAAGNMINDGVYAYTWDAESRIKSAAGVTYTYDGDGERVAKSTGKLYWTGGGSDPLAESDAAGNITDEFIFFGGKRIARRDAAGNVYYFLADHLGTARVMTNATGIIVQESDHYPFGGERVIVNTVDNRYKFTGKERDAESGNDYFGARYFAPRMGRWLSPDWSSAPVAVPYVDFSNPQSLNLYAYVENNPITGIDPDGHFRLGTAADANSQYQDPDLPPPAEMSTLQFLKEEVKGVWDVTGGALVALGRSVLSGEAKENIAETARLAVNNPAAIGEALKEGGRQLAETVKSAASGDPRAIGQVVGMVATAVAPGAKSTPSNSTLASRAAQIHRALDPIAQRMRTTAVARVTTASGRAQVMVASSRPTLAPLQRAALRRGEIAVAGQGHAEMTILSAAARNGSRVRAIATSPRSSCPSCTAALKRAGVKIVD